MLEVLGQIGGIYAIMLPTFKLIASKINSKAMYNKIARAMYFKISKSSIYINNKNQLVKPPLATEDTTGLLNK